MTKTKPDISIIIPVFNGGKAFQACLQSLEVSLHQWPSLAAQVIVVDDGCTDGSARLAKDFGNCPWHLTKIGCFSHFRSKDRSK